MTPSIRENIGRLEEDHALAAVTGIPGLKLYRNIYIPQGSGKTAEIDLLIVSRKGVFAVEVKGFGGVITGSNVRYEWVRCRKRKGSEGDVVTRFYNPVRQSEQHLAAITRYLGMPANSCCGLVVFSDRAVLKKVPPNTGSCVILQTRELSAVVRCMLARRKERFSAAELRQLEAKLDVIPKVGESTRRLHIAQAKRAERVRKAEQERRRRQRGKRR